MISIHKQRCRLMKCLWILAASVLLTVSAPAQAWNKAGHMVSGAIAYQTLKRESPKSIGQVIAVLKQHPQYESTWLRRLEAIPNLNDDDRDLYLFMLAARWPDDIRSNDDFHHSPWHYINMPFKPEGEPATVRPAAPDSDNILRAYEVNLAKLKNRNESLADRAVALCWVFHLVGDGHQPLHVTQLFTTQFPKGDRGGNKFYIRAKPDASPITLHKYWDDLIIGSDRFQDTRNRAIELRNRPEFAKDKLKEFKETNFEKWVSVESFQAAKDVAYRHGKLKGGTEAPEAVVLPDDYSASAKPLAERRIILAGYRMAELMKKMAELNK